MKPPPSSTRPRRASRRRSPRSRARRRGEGHLRRPEPRPAARVPVRAAERARRHQPYPRPRRRRARRGHADDRRARAAARRRARRAVSGALPDDRRGRSRRSGTPRSATAARSAGASRTPTPPRSGRRLALALDAELDVVGPAARAPSPARDFFVSYFTTALAPDELLAGAPLPRPERPLRARPSSSSPAGMATSRSPASARWSRWTTTASSPTCRIGLIGVGATARARAERPRRPLAGDVARPRKSSPRPRRAVDADIDPQRDVHASADYRRHIAGVLVRRAARDGDRPGRRGGDDGRA